MAPTDGTLLVEAGTSTGKGATWLLLHGAWHGGWCYDRLAGILRDRGDRVFAPSLAGPDTIPPSQAGLITCATHVDEVVALVIREDLRDVILCGHSYGALVAASVADAVPGRIAALLFLDANYPEPGQSLFDMLADPALAASVIQACDAFDGVNVPPLPAEAFNVNPADRAMVDHLCRPQPLATFREAPPLTGRFETVPRIGFVLATDWNAPHRQRERIQAKLRQHPGWTLHEMACGHDMMLDAPGQLAQILLAVAVA